MHAIEMEKVTKTFGIHTAVDELSLCVPVGSIYGFIGPNGSGKTTTLRMIMHIIHADRGRIAVLGGQSCAAANDRVGYLPEERGLYRQMKVVDLLRFFAQLKGHAATRAEINSWLERMDLSEWADRKVEALSKGMSQKVQFIATVIARRNYFCWTNRSAAWTRSTRRWSGRFCWNWCEREQRCFSQRMT